METLEISLKMVTKGGMKILISDFYHSGSQTQEAQQGHPQITPEIRQLSLGLAKPGAADLGCLGGCPSLLRAILSNEHMFHQIDPRGVFEVRNVCGSPSLLVFFLPNFCEGFVPVIQCIVESFPKCHTFFTIPGPCL